MTIQLSSLFGQLALVLDMPTTSKFNHTTHQYEQRYLKLDFNSVYGGYRIDIVNQDTSEDFFWFSSRMSRKEMTAFIQGFLVGIDKMAIRKITQREASHD